MNLTDREKQVTLTKIRKLLATIYNINNSAAKIEECQKTLNTHIETLKESGMDEDTIAHHAIRQN